jgi:ferritin-like metal-binding protein YciE
MAKATSKRTSAKKTVNRSAAKKSNGRTTSKRSTAQANSKKTASKPTGAQKGENQSGSMLQDFFLESLKDIYWAEKALTKALPKMSKSATSPELKKAFDQHVEVTKKQIVRLEQVFEQLGEKAQGKKCHAIQGLIEESEEIISETKDDTSTRDAALIIAAQKVEHYEIATYGGLVQLAKTMNKKGIASTLETTLNEEKDADVQLTKVAEKSINVEAAGEESEGQSNGSSLKEKVMGLFS